MQWCQWLIIGSIIASLGINLHKVYGYMSGDDDPSNPQNIIIQYCIDHADRVAAGENVVNTLVHAGMVPSGYLNETCSQVKERHDSDKSRAEADERIRRALGID